MKLKLRRTGSFTAYWKDTTNMCGTTSNTFPTYNYICEIECAPLLDGNGFIVDQLDIDKYFQRKYAAAFGRHVAQSCENIALTAIKDVRGMVENHMMVAHGESQIHRIAITISLMENAAMTAEWSPNEPATRKPRRSKVGERPTDKTGGRQRVPNPPSPVSRPTTGRPETDAEGKRAGSGRPQSILISGPEWYNTQSRYSKRFDF